MLPYTIAKYIYWYANWIYKFNLCKQEYGIEEKFYLIKKYMGCSTAQWVALEDNEKDAFLRKKLWIKGKFVVS